jgi:hypothetical protein
MRQCLLDAGPLIAFLDAREAGRVATGSERYRLVCRQTLNLRFAGATSSQRCGFELHVST